MSYNAPSYEDRIIEQYDIEIAEAEEKLKELTFDKDYDGIIVYKYIKCGKQGCRCSLDISKRILHGPYPHFQYRKNGILHQKYLNRKNVKEYREKVDANNAYKEAKREVRKLKKKKQDYMRELKSKETEEE